jgi:ABC-2 type transport system ATP-binding protein
MENYIKINNLSKSIKGNKILDNINLSLTKGKIYGIKGRNGSGKTMLMRAICGLITPNTGEVIIDGVNITTTRSLPQNIGAIIDSVGFLNYLNGIDNLKLLAEIRNKIDEDKIKEHMKAIGLSYDDKKKVKSYSLGMKQKLAIVQAIMEEPEILLLDEATNGLDEDSVKTFNSIITDLKKRNVTIILTNHNFEELREICDEIIEIDNGRIKNIYINIPSIN